MRAPVRTWPNAPCSSCEPAKSESVPGQGSVPIAGVNSTSPIISYKVAVGDPGRT